MLKPTLAVLSVCIGLLITSSTSYAEQQTENTPVPEDASDVSSSDSTALNKSTRSVYVIPVEGPIGKPTLYIVRRGVKEATAKGIDTVVLQVDTPGGELGVTLEIMKILDRFEGETIAFINEEAISAGAFISIITDRIFMHPNSQIGAAEVVSGTGQDIPESMKRKLQSYINAKVRVYTESYRYRGDVMRAMTDPDFEFEIEETVFSTEGELLSLIASEAVQAYGDPPENLLAEGIAEDLDGVLTAAYGQKQYEIKSFEVTWSEEFAQAMQGVIPVVMGIGMLLLFIEFKTPNFGILGGLGIALIVVVFLSNYIAGLAGHEAILLFALGVILFAVEIFILPGTLIFAFSGIALIFASLVWSLSDFWPKSDGFGFEVDWDQLLNSGFSVMISTAGALVALVLLWKTPPIRWLESKLTVLDSSPSPSPVAAGGAVRASDKEKLPEIGAVGVVKTPLHPVGKVDIEGRYFEANSAHGSIDRNAKVKVVGYHSYCLVVEKVNGEDAS